MKQISELIEIFCFLGLKKTRGFFKDFRASTTGAGAEKIKNKKKSIKNSWLYISAKKRLLFWGNIRQNCDTQLDLGEIRFYAISGLLFVYVVPIIAKSIIDKTLEF